MRKGFALAVALLLLSAAPGEAKVVTKRVSYSHAGVKLEGLLAYDDARTAKGKLPGVLVLPEWWGLTAYPKGRAEQLAAMGYVAFAADMYGAGVTADDPKKAGELASPFYGKPVMAERARAGLDQLLGSGLVDPAKVAAIGFCFGGSAAQVLAYSGAPVAGIVSFHGGAMKAPVEAAGKIKAKFLLLNGASDPMVKPEDRVSLEKSLEDAKVDYQSVVYAHALHGFTNPEADRYAKMEGLGGAVRYDAAAARRSWKAMQVFFDELFAGH